MYLIGELAALAAISRRTIRHYEEIGLIEPNNYTTAGYCLYDQKTVDLLQEILLFRRMNISLKNIKKILQAPGFTKLQSLEGHLVTLQAETIHLQPLIAMVQKNIAHEKGYIYV